MAHYEEIKDQLEAERLAQLAARQAEREAEQVTYYGLGITSETLQQDEDDAPIILGLTTPDHEPYVNPYLEQAIDAWAESTPTSEADAAMRDYILRNRDSFVGFRMPDERPEVDLIYDNLTDEDKRTLNRIAFVVAATAMPALLPVVGALGASAEAAAWSFATSNPGLITAAAKTAMLWGGIDTIDDTLTYAWAGLGNPNAQEQVLIMESVLGPQNPFDGLNFAFALSSTLLSKRMVFSPDHLSGGGGIGSGNSSQKTPEWWMSGELMEEFTRSFDPDRGPEWGALFLRNKNGAVSSIALYDESGRMISDINYENGAWHWHEYPPGQPQVGHTHSPEDRKQIEDIRAFLERIGFDEFQIETVTGDK